MFAAVSAAYSIAEIGDNIILKAEVTELMIILVATRLWQSFIWEADSLQIILSPGDILVELD